MHNAPPPLNALRFFEVAARHLNLTKTAVELNVTPGALSHQIRGLEDHLGLKLFDRGVRSIALTAVGKALHEAIAPHGSAGTMTKRRVLSRAQDPPTTRSEIPCDRRYGRYCLSSLKAIQMFSFLAQGSPTTIGFLLVCLALVLAFEFSNGFHDTANAVATVIYTNSLKPLYAVVWSGLMNFLGVILGGIAVAYALVQLIPPEVLSPPNGGTAVGMLAALFIAALVWNVGTWWLGIPNSSSRALTGALIGIALANSIKQARGFGNGVDFSQVKSVLSSLLFSPIIGFALAFIIFRLLKLAVHDKRLYEPREATSRRSGGCEAC